MIVDDDFPLHLRPLSLSERHRFGAAEYVLEGWVGGQWIAIPVHRVADSGGASAECYAIDVMGIPLAEGRLIDLVHAVRRLLHALVYGGRFPCYAMEISPVGVALPVYPWGEGWRVHEPDGPILEAGDLGILRQRVADAHGLPVEAIRVRVLSERLAWVLPAAVFRPAIGSVPWLPVAWSESGWRLHFMGALLSAPGNGVGIWSLWEAVADQGVRQGWLHAPEDLTLEIWSGSAWETIQSALAEATVRFRFYEAGRRLRAVLLPIFRGGERWVAVYATREQRTVFVGRDLIDLQRRAGEALHAAGCLPDPWALRMELGETGGSPKAKHALLVPGR
ncbi:hypothetical protein HRbin22_01714 [Candidatus Thermoflexus japonica]|uniref:Uncharacterized protein n=1 Tax=Candidatus Thermoflexus japonica TaxID=2035417 RepID=A0A2H5Y7P4_9CHLR|nr:hypothetical protein HRbin22_01714 [Candidatus Thermoflexus japonica]